MQGNNNYDVIVLGGGPGGYECAIRCAQYGLTTALIEARDLGGTCLNRGCVPTKALLHGSELFHEISSAEKIGITATASLDYEKLHAFKDEKVAKLRSGISQLLTAHGVTVYTGFGRLADASHIEVNGELLAAENIVLATGSAPSLPPIPGSDGARVMTSDGALEMNILPKSVVLIGGGVIGMEFATLFSDLGCEVTVLEMMPGILPGVDADIVATLTQQLKKRKVRILTGAKVLKIEDAAQSAAVTFEVKGAEETASAEYVILCAGRRPMTANIGLEEAGVALQKGFVQVDDNLRTSVPNIYAIGDITGKIQLAHVASAQGHAAAANCAGKPHRMRYDIVPACIYTTPEIAYVGMDEQAASAAGHVVKTGIFQMSGNGRAMLMGQNTGFIKLVTDERTGQILGAQMMAPRATDMIAEIAAVMRCEGTIEELADTIHPHPTVSETIMEAALDALGICCNAMPKA